MKLNLKKSLQKTKRASLFLAAASLGKKNEALSEIARELAMNQERIIRENKKDLKLARENKLTEAFIDRLDVSGRRFKSIIHEVRKIKKLADPLGETIEEHKLANGVSLKKVRVPLGVIGIIYESRPNVTIDAAALVLKSGNAVVLKGGSDAINTNRAMIRCVHRALIKVGLPADSVLFLDTTDRSVVDQLIKEDTFVDVIIPRGGYDLVRKVADHSRVPVLYHAEGGARIYIDASADLKMAIDICVNAKTSRPGVCNALDTIVVHKAIARKFLKEFAAAVFSVGVEIRGDDKTRSIIAAKKAVEADYRKEFLDLIVAIKVVGNICEAVDFINKYSKRHSEGIVANDKKAVVFFTEHVDAAALFINCSTRLHDGGVFEMGAEMGIATGKLHARGPVGLRELTTYKWIAYGKGQIRN